jgi:hypothetical protein
VIILDNYPLIYFYLNSSYSYAGKQQISLLSSNSWKNFPHASSSNLILLCFSSTNYIGYNLHFSEAWELRNSSWSLESWSWTVLYRQRFFRWAMQNYSILAYLHQFSVKIWFAIPLLSDSNCVFDVFIERTIVVNSMNCSNALAF